MAPPLLLCAFVLAAGGIKPPVPAEPIYSALAGAWVGALEYRNYSSNARVFLPTTLTILSETRLSGGAFQFRHQYTLTRVGPATTGD